METSKLLQWYGGDFGPDPRGILGRGAGSLLSVSQSYQCFITIVFPCSLHILPAQPEIVGWVAGVLGAGDPVGDQLQKALQGEVELAFRWGGVAMVADV